MNKLLILCFLPDLPSSRAFHVPRQSSSMKRAQQVMPVSQVRRRNGQQSSCENCRKSKLACDHAVPHCGRCTRLKRTDTCVYVLSPLDKSSTPGTGKSSAVKKRQTKMQTSSLANAISSVHRPISSGSPIVESAAFMLDWTRAKGVETPSSSRLEISTKNTSWRSIFSEFNIEVESDVRIPSRSGGIPLEWKDPELLKHATTALEQIPARAICDQLLAHAVKYPDFGCQEPYLRLLHEGWWGNLERYLEKDPSSNILRPVIEQLWVNTTSRLIQSPWVGSEGWLSTSTGLNTTWDSLAYLLSAYGSACASLHPSNPLLADDDKGQLCRDMGKGIKACLFICESQGICSVNLLNAHASMVLLQNSYDGDDCKCLHWKGVVSFPVLDSDIKFAYHKAYSKPKLYEYRSSRASCH